MKKLFNQRGMSMVEGMISVALMAAGAAAALNMDKLNFEQLGLVAGSAKTLDIIQHAHSTLQDLAACENTLKDEIPGSGATIPGVSDRSGNVFSVPGKSYDGLLVKDIQLEAPSLARQTYASPGAPGLVELRFVFQNMKRKTPQDIIRRFKVWVLTDATGKITRCQTPMLMSTSLWQRSSTNPDDIYYGGGEVGIGTIDPQVDLDVDGRIQFATNDGQKGVIGKGGTVPRIEFDANRPVGVIRLDGSRSGILLKDLLLSDVAKLMGYPSGVLLCTPALAGALRYNTTTNTFQFCGGDKWRSIVNVP